MGYFLGFRPLKIKGRGKDNSNPGTEVTKSSKQ